MSMELEAEACNPSLRFYCTSRITLDTLLSKIEEARKLNDVNLLDVLLQMYLGFRKSVRCEGCVKGEKVCIHWSEKSDIEY